MRITLLALVVGAAACSVLPGTAAQTAEVTDQVNRSIELASGSDVRISGINGQVYVETAEGLAAAELRVTIEASSREAMERRPLIVENTPDTLIVRTETDGRGSWWRREWVRHEVRVRLPRNVNLRVSGVNGRVDVGEIGGTVGLSGINGRTTVVHAGSASAIDGINGRTTISVARLEDQGLRVSGINGGISIGLPDDLNADIDVSAVNGGVDSDLPLTVTGDVRRGRLRGSLGSGGPPIVISAVNGGVRLTRQARPPG
jgi:hypothetical protein